MKGADILVAALVREGVEVVFAYPGGASMELHQALVKGEEDVRTILPRFEQGGGFMAHGYAVPQAEPVSSWLPADRSHQHDDPNHGCVCG